MGKVYHERYNGTRCLRCDWSWLTFEEIKKMHRLVKKTKAIHDPSNLIVQASGAYVQIGGLNMLLQVQSAQWSCGPHVQSTHPMDDMHSIYMVQVQLIISPPIGTA